MAKCPNCGAGMSCGCQKRAASNGATACSSCINSLEATIKANNTAALKAATNVQPKKTSQKWGPDRYNK